MFRKLFVIVVSALVLCPQVDASTFTFTSPAAGATWSSTAIVMASGNTNAPGGAKIKVKFAYYDGASEVLENDVVHTVIGTVAGPNGWLVHISPPSHWNLWPPGTTSDYWRKSPTPGTPPVMIKDHFFKVFDWPPVGNDSAYRNDQGVT